MYERRSRLNYRQQAELIKFFVAGATARAAGEMAGVNRNTATSYFMRLRRLIASHLPSYRLSGEIEADESYFGGVRKGKRGRGAAGKIAVFGLLKRNGRVYTAIIPDARTETLLPIIKEQVEPDSIVYTDTFSAYNALDINGFHHHRINHSQKFFGIRPKGTCVALTVSSLNTFTGSSRNANGVSMEAIINSS